MDSEEHLVLGAFTGLVVYGISRLFKNQKPSLKGAISSMVIGGITALAPDIIEPPSSPNHRSFFHSIVLLALLFGGNYRIWQDNRIPREVKEVITLVSSSYGSHLLSDFSTPKRLPLII